MPNFLPTFAVLALALLSLLVGSMVEPPVAKAGPAPRPAPAAGLATPKGDNPSPYRVVSEDNSVEFSRRNVAVALPHRLNELEITKIADVVRAKEKTPFEKTIVSFYLPGMKLTQSAWAMATFNPTLKINIVGLRLDEEQQATAEVAADGRAVIGVWLTASPAAPGRLTLYRSGKKILAERRLRDGAKSVTEMIETRGAQGRRFTPATGGEAHLLLAWGGELELRDGATIIAVAERLAGFGEGQNAKGSARILRSRRPVRSAAAAE